MTPTRRVVTGLDAEGRSCLLIDGPSPTVIWSTGETPADNSGSADAGADTYWFPTAGSNVTWIDFEPHNTAFMHATDTIDYVVVLDGEVALVTETGETLLRAGDVLIDRGVMHAWRNDSDSPCRIVAMAIPSHPVGRGATLAGEIRRS